MSCDGNRAKFLAHACAAGSPAAQAFGGASEAQAALETIFEHGRVQASQMNAMQQRVAEVKTRALFAMMQRAHPPITPPTHAKNGLPKKDAQFGYAAMYDTLTALETGTPLPAVAAQLSRQRTLTATRVDDRLARLRCGSCGRFTPAVGAHLCPNTATPQALQGALRRRLGVPDTAYPTTALGELITQARGDGVRMVHPASGEVVQATLDSLPLAITSGFVPESWGTLATLAEVSNGRVAPVLNMTGLTRAALPPSPLAMAALMSGSTATAAPAPSATATPVPSAAVMTGTTATPPTLTGGTVYDRNHWHATEFRKDHGWYVSADGLNYQVGQRSDDPQDWASARQRGDYPAPPATGKFAGIGVPRTLVEAVGLYHAGGSVITRDAAGAVQRVELTNADGNLLAVYDVATRTVGDVDGTSNASAAQSAAIMAALAAQGGDPLREGLARDLRGFDPFTGGTTRTPLAAADAAYLAIDAVFKTDGPITMGALVGAARCPHCGKWMASTGCACPGARTAAAAAPPPPPVAAPEPTPPTPVAVAPPPPPPEPPVAAAPPPPVAAPPPPVGDAALTDRLVAALDGVSARLDRLTGRETPPRPAPGLPAAPPSAPPPRSGRDLRETLRDGAPTATPTAAGAVLADLVLPRPDPNLPGVPPQLIPDGYTGSPPVESVKADYQLTGQARRIMSAIAQQLEDGHATGRVNTNRTFAIYGPPGSGKNELVRQLAANVRTRDADGTIRQGLPCVELEFAKDVDLTEQICSTRLEGGSTVSKLGPVGLAAAQGAVISLNEVVNNPKALAQFQSMFEEGVIRVPSPEGGLTEVPVHPSTVFVMTWNPALEGMGDRPSAAPLARSTPFELPPPTPDEQISRVMAAFADRPRDRQPLREEVRQAVSLFSQITQAISTGDLQRRGGSGKAVPGPRELHRFVQLGARGAWRLALETLRVYTDQVPPDEKQAQWQMLETLFTTNFGDDGQQIRRQATGRGPVRA